MQTVTYEEFAAHLPELLDKMAKDGEPLLVRQNGRLFRVSLSTAAEEPSKLPPIDLEAQKRAFEAARGILKGIDREAFKKELRAMRAQRPRGRKA